MAGSYSIGDIQAQLFTSYPVYEIVGLSANYPKITEMIFTTWPLITAQVTTLGVGVPAAIGSGGNVDARSVLAEDLGPKNYVQVVTDWTNKPTVPAKFFRRISLLGTATGNAGRFRLKFPRGLAVPLGSSIVVWCITSAQWGNFIEMSLVLES